MLLLAKSITILKGAIIMKSRVVVVVSKTDSYIRVTESGEKIRSSGVGNTSAGGWRNSPIISAIPGIRNRRPQK